MSGGWEKFYKFSSVLGVIGFGLGAYTVWPSIDPRPSKAAILSVEPLHPGPASQLAKVVVDCRHLKKDHELWLTVEEIDPAPLNREVYPVAVSSSCGATGWVQTISIGGDDTSRDDRGLYNVALYDANRTRGAIFTARQASSTPTPDGTPRDILAPSDIPTYSPLSTMQYERTEP